MRNGCSSFLRGMYETTPVTYDAIYIMVNAEDHEERDRLTRNWRNHKIEELSFVGTAVRYLQQHAIHLH